MNELRHKAAGASEKMREWRGPLGAATAHTGSLEPMESLAASARLLAGVNL